MHEEINSAKQARQEADFISFQLKELTEARLQATEQEDLESNLEVLRNAEGIKAIMSKISRTLDEEDNSISDRVTGLMRELHALQVSTRVFKTSTIG